MKNHLLKKLTSLFHKNEPSNDNNFPNPSVKLESLAPIDYAQISSDEFETDYYKIYKDVLNNITQDKHITNVGVTGGYGTGKSSIIHSYFNELKSKTSIYISLAHFNSLAGNTLPPSQNDKAINSQIDNILEMKIVNQLVNQIEPDKIPKANFLAKKNINNNKIIFYSLSIICLILYFKFLLPLITEKITYSIQIFPPNLEFIDYILIIISIIAIISLYYLLSNVIKKIVHKGNWSKLTINTMGINVNMENRDFSTVSYFDNFLSDVIYLFDESEAEFVIFEDLDRFNDHSIFEKLREINLMVNQRRNSAKRKKIKKIMFFYVISDEVFSEKNVDPANNSKNISATEKTKFFDVIIPTIPIVNNTNSFDYLKSRLLDDLAITDKNDFETFLYQVSIFIDDLRVLKNIVNEFKIYKEIHKNNIKIDYKQLLALIIYKTLDSSDFNDLVKSKGDLYTQIKNSLEDNDE
ncbi:hypothetical protein [Streptococcus oralis]|uniref:YobI-like P-loop NTPase domain-containing protein n=1 Tax=Streptococcus oralis subsp. dentisani TaxID=1458253 RepID=A0A1X1JC38_STROR|nr:hypothetical protein [Streptococcus oralis]ORO84161.1 hypothetical protein B7705_04400 [Streptococcus oralis subsp. dentisani]